ncbi:MAG: glutamine--fructose-6-phosphate transaminase (isomerizing) [Gammaproteobacteria bacterium]
MCGIVGAIAERDIVSVLMEGLRRLEYRGYDSAGLAVLNDKQLIKRHRAQGKVKKLAEILEKRPLQGNQGIAHTRWATHGVPSEHNAHPHFSGENIAVVHNGIIENYEALREELKQKGYHFESETDTEVAAHLLAELVKEKGNLFEAMQEAAHRFRGAFALLAISKADPECMAVARRGCPVVIGHGENENFVASDVAALISVTRQFTFLEEGDVAKITREAVTVCDRDGNMVERPIKKSDLSADAIERGDFRHYMLKEIFEQPHAIAETLEERLAEDHILEAAFGLNAPDLFERIRHVRIVACGTSFHAALVARYTIERYANLPCSIDLASEYRYRKPHVPENCLFVTISQSGETLDTLEALRLAKQQDYLSTLTICNVAESSLVRESDMVLLTRAGPEIGVASTKAFTTQLVALILFCVVLARHNGMSAEREAAITQGLKEIAGHVESALGLNETIRELANRFADKEHALFLGRGVHFPIAMEGALKLKEISYIHAEAYAAGELKHGPLALVDSEMPVIAVAPNDKLLAKLKGNLQEVRARGGELIVFADPETGIEAADGITVITMPYHTGPLTEPIVYTIPLQLLAYHVAVLKGTDVDQPRNLAKSVTVE